MRRRIPGRFRPAASPGGGEHIDIDTELAGLEEDSPSRATSAGLTTPSTVLESNNAVDAEDVRAAFHEAQLVIRAQEKQIVGLLAERDTATTSRKAGRSRAREGLAELALGPEALQLLADVVVNTGSAYAVQVRPWVPVSIFEYSARPDIDPLSAEQRYPSGQDAKAAAVALRDAQAAELFDFIPSVMESHITNVWVQRLFCKAVNVQKGHAIDKAKVNRAAIFEHLSDLNEHSIDITRLFAKKATQQQLIMIREDPSCKYWAGTATQRFPPILYPPGKVGQKKYIFQNPSIGMTLRPMLYGTTALEEGHRPRSNTNGMRWQIRSVSFGMIALGATVARFFLSGDKALEEVGQPSGINYKADFDAWVMRLILHQDSPSIQSLLARMDKFVIGSMQSGAQPALDGEAVPDDDNGWDELDDPVSDEELDSVDRAGRHTCATAGLHDTQDEWDLEYSEDAGSNSEHMASSAAILNRPPTPGGVPAYLHHDSGNSALAVPTTSTHQATTSTSETADSAVRLVSTPAVQAGYTPPEVSARPITYASRSEVQTSRMVPTSAGVNNPPHRFSSMSTVSAAGHSETVGLTEGMQTLRVTTSINSNTLAALGIGEASEDCDQPDANNGEKLPTLEGNNTTEVPSRGRELVRGSRGRRSRGSHGRGDGTASRSSRQVSGQTMPPSTVTVPPPRDILDNTSPITRNGKTARMTRSRAAAARGS